MPQRDADLWKRGSVPQHPRGQAVAQQMGPFERRRQSSPRQRASHNRADGAGIGEASPWRSCTEKHAPRRVWRAIPTEIGGERVADLGQQGKSVLRQPLATADEDLSGTPANVVEF